MNDQLDGLLTAAGSAPRSATSERRAEVVAMAAMVTAPARGRTARRASLIGGTALGLLAVGGAAAAVVGFPWSDSARNSIGWFDEAVMEYTYQVPSGVTCHQVIGGLNAVDPEVSARVTQLLVDSDLSVTQQDIDEQIRIMRADDWTYNGDDGEVDGGYGTAYYPTVDGQYQMAVSRALGDKVGASLDANGATWDWSIEGAGECEAFVATYPWETEG